MVKKKATARKKAAARTSGRKKAAAPAGRAKIATAERGSLAAEEEPQELPPRGERRVAKKRSSRTGRR